MGEFPEYLPLKKLKNHPVSNFRFRSGNYRIIFDVDWTKNEIYILKIGHRRDIY
ncbi:MAG TPA: type II toxin-antitoxin system RelE/ParE family toxin [Deltaproteobacteria bacterium]|nr:type II toxin-antitoxin system RelE/ParE family toxin [Deltaproteobacteria bacterium]